MCWLASSQPHEVKQESVLLPEAQIPKVPLPYFCVHIPVILVIIQHLALGAVRLGLSPGPQALRAEALSVVSTITPALFFFSPTHPVRVRPREHLKRGSAARAILPNTIPLLSTERIPAVPSEGGKEGCRQLSGLNDLSFAHV